MTSTASLLTVTVSFAPRVAKLVTRVMCFLTVVMVRHASGHELRELHREAHGVDRELRGSERELHGLDRIAHDMRHGAS
jgi:hypothetical protein